MGFPRQEYWSGLPFPFPRDLPDPGIKPISSALSGGFFTTELAGKLQYQVFVFDSCLFMQENKEMKPMLIHPMEGWEQVADRFLAIPVVT